jgi:hypothetical protein
VREEALMSELLPDFERPPVVEVVAAVQFVPIARFGMREATLAALAFEGWEDRRRTPCS